MFSPEQEAYFEKIADVAVEKLFNRSMKTLGIDPENHEEVQKIHRDFVFIRTLREGLDDSLSWARKSLVGLAIAGIVGVLIKSSKHWFLNG